jgi:hypothetical protein
MRKASARLTYANVTASLALFIALGGGAYAAATLPKNSVGPAQIKKNAVSSTKVKDGSLLKKEFKAGQLPAGATGPAGAKGDKGDAGANGTNGTNGTNGARGPSDVFLVRDDTGIALGTSQTDLVTLSLPAGKFLVIGKVVSNNQDNTVGNEARITCRLTGPSGQIDESVGGSSDNTQFDDLDTVALMDVLDLAVAGDVTLSCARSGATSVSTSDVKLVGVKTETLTIAP